MGQIRVVATTIMTIAENTLTYCWLDRGQVVTGFSAILFENLTDAIAGRACCPEQRLL
jgi:hypothetical protein